MERATKDAIEAAGIAEEAVLSSRSYPSGEVVVVTMAGQKFSFDGASINQTMGHPVPALAPPAEDVPDTGAGEGEAVEIMAEDDGPPWTCPVEGCGKVYRKHEPYLDHLAKKHPYLQVILPEEPVEEVIDDV